jgi:hypothetical protein
MLPRPYAERDVEDVEEYVRETVGHISPYIGSDEREQLVARGIMLVSRMAQALPPDASLEALLHERLGNSLVSSDVLPHPLIRHRRFCAAPFEVRPLAWGREVASQQSWQSVPRQPWATPRSRPR